MSAEPYGRIVSGLAIAVMSALLWCGVLLVAFW